ncbi:TPA: hypothetical protein NZK16_001017 [Acinetobacter baumannii]|nr:hypothetical protein [Acinetobacter baumannii]
MKFRYSSMTRTLIVIGDFMNHHFDNVNASEINQCLYNVLLKEGSWRK